MVIKYKKNSSCFFLLKLILGRKKDERELNSLGHIYERRVINDAKEEIKNKRETVSKDRKIKKI